MRFPTGGLTGILCVAVILAPVSALEGAYSRIGGDSMTVIDGTRWYLEEYDALGRPYRGTRWEGSVIVSRVSWLYAGNAGICESRTVVDTTGSEETRFNARGSETKIEKRDLDGNLVFETFRFWDEENRETARETRSGNTTAREEWSYDREGALVGRKVFKNGVCILDAVYESENTWTETVFAKGQPVLTERYENGRRAVKP